ATPARTRIRAAAAQALPSTDRPRPIDAFTLLPGAPSARSGQAAPPPSHNLADEVLSDVGASLSLVDGHLGVRAERACPNHDASNYSRSGNGIWRSAILDPSLECRERIERARSVTSCAVPHPRHHEQPIRRAHRSLAARSGGHALEVVDAVGRSHRLVAPAVVLQELASTLEERLEVRVDGVHDPTVRLLGATHVDVQIECAVVPVGIAKD